MTASLNLKSPAGVYTQLTIPAQDIAPIIQGRIVSNVDLSLKALPQEDWKFAFEAPANVLILPKDSMDTFFRNNNVENNITSSGDLMWLRPEPTHLET